MDKKPDLELIINGHTNKASIQQKRIVELTASNASSLTIKGSITGQFVVSVALKDGEALFVFNNREALIEGLKELLPETGFEDNGLDP